SRMRHVIGGTANTLLASEGPARSASNAATTFREAGSYWRGGSCGQSCFTTVETRTTNVADRGYGRAASASNCKDNNNPLAPCTGLGGSLGGYWLNFARSYHPGGVTVAMADGSARFVSNNIARETWHALSTKAGREVIGEF